MPLVLNERVQADLAFLGKLPPESIRDFCGVCLDFVEAGAKRSMFSRAATALQVDVDTVAGGVMVLTEVLLAASKIRSTEHELTAALGDVDIPDTHRKVITEFYAHSLKRLRAHLSSVEESPASQLKSWDWRLQVTVSSRLAHDRMDPSFLLRIDTVAPTVAEPLAALDSTAATRSECASLHATSDYAALKRVSDALDEAAAEMKTAHSRRVVRYIR